MFAATAPFLDFLPMPFNFVILIIVIVFSWLLLACVVEQIGKYARHREQIELKRELLDRGLEADEIKTILEAGVDGIRQRRRVKLGDRWP